MLTVRRALVKSELEFYVKWLEYIPNFWNLNRILDKKVKNLTSNELNLLLQINNDKEKANYLKQFINMIKTDNKNKVAIVHISKEDDEKISNIIKSFDIEKIANLKLDDNELNSINKIVDYYDLNNEEEIISKINSFDNEYMIEYSKVLLRKKELYNDNNVKQFKIAK